MNITVGGLEHILLFHNTWDNHPNWLVFFKMVKTTNQIFLCFKNCFCMTPTIYWGWSALTARILMHFNAPLVAGMVWLVTAADVRMTCSPWSTWALNSAKLRRLDVPSGKLTLLLKMVIYSEFSHWKCGFSIAMLNYQRVYLVALAWYF